MVYLLAAMRLLVVLCVVVALSGAQAKKKPVKQKPDQYNNQPQQGQGGQSQGGQGQGGQSQGGQSQWQSHETAAWHQPERHMAVHDPPIEITEQQEHRMRPRGDGHPAGTRKQPDHAGTSYGHMDGRSSSRIVNGTDASRGMFPWQIYHIANSAYFCGGSLISSAWVITAGHCVVGFTSFEVTMGACDRSVQESGTVTMTTTKKYLHPGYKTGIYINDIALLHLPRDVKFSRYIGPVRLPRQSEATETFEGYLAIASGWGQTTDGADAPLADKLQYVEMDVVSNAECAATYGTTVITSSKICAKGTPNDKGNPCEGDSGGPLVIRESDGKYTLIGSDSFGPKESCLHNKPEGFSRITSYLSWISNHTGIAIQP